MVGLPLGDECDLLKRVFAHKVGGIIIPVLALVVSVTISFLVGAVAFDVFDDNELTINEEVTLPMHFSIPIALMSLTMINAITLIWSNTWRFPLLLTLYNLARPPLVIMTYSQGQSAFLVLGCWIDVILFSLAGLLLCVNHYRKKRAAHSKEPHPPI